MIFKAMTPQLLMMLPEMGKPVLFEIMMQEDFASLIPISMGKILRHYHFPGDLMEAIWNFR